MIPQQLSKFVSITEPAAQVTAASATCSAVDRLDYDYAVITVFIGANSGAAVTALSLSESDDNSTWTAITGADFSVSPATLPTSSTANAAYRFYVDCKARKRYLKPTITVGTGGTGIYLAAFAELGRPMAMPSTDTLRGLGESLIL